MKHFLKVASPALDYGLTLMDEAYHMIENATAAISDPLIKDSEVLDRDAWYRRAFTPDSKYVFFASKTGTRFFRTSDGTKVCTLQKSINMIINTQGSCHVLQGMIDPLTRKYYTWSIENLLHLCRYKI